MLARLGALFTLAGIPPYTACRSFQIWNMVTTWSVFINRPSHPTFGGPVSERSPSNYYKARIKKQFSFSFLKNEERHEDSVVPKFEAS